jgi:hypothetical protein
MNPELHARLADYVHAAKKRDRRISIEGEIQKAINQYLDPSSASAIPPQEVPLSHIEGERPVGSSSSTMASPEAIRYMRLFLDIYESNSEKREIILLGLKAFESEVVNNRERLRQSHTTENRADEKHTKRRQPTGT